jgi:hypothetical protein
MASPDSWQVVMACIQETLPTPRSEPNSLEPPPQSTRSLPHQHNTSSGVFHCRCYQEENLMDHAVVLVGYGTENGKNYWWAAPGHGRCGVASGPFLAWRQGGTLLLHNVTAAPYLLIAVTWCRWCPAVQQAGDCPPALLRCLQADAQQLVCPLGGQGLLQDCTQGGPIRD